jgi:hypothetical protein
MSSSSLIITSNNTTRVGSTFTMRFPRSINFQNKEIGLISSQFFYSNPNISASAFNNNKVTIRYIQQSKQEKRKIETIVLVDKNKEDSKMVENRRSKSKL